METLNEKKHRVINYPVFSDIYQSTIREHIDEHLVRLKVLFFSPAEEKLFSSIMEKSCIESFVYIPPKLEDGIFLNYSSIIFNLSNGNQFLFDVNQR